MPSVRLFRLDRIVADIWTLGSLVYFWWHSLSLSPSQNQQSPRYYSCMRWWLNVNSLLSYSFRFRCLKLRIVELTTGGSRNGPREGQRLPVLGVIVESKFIMRPTNRYGGFHRFHASFAVFLSTTTLTIICKVAVIKHTSTHGSSR